MNQKSNIYYYQNEISYFYMRQCFFNLSKLISINSFSETHIFSNIICSSHVYLRNNASSENSCG